MPLNAIIYDIEILKAVPDRNGKRVDGVEYCEGWKDHANMGISVIGVYDYATERGRVFCNDNIRDWHALLDRNPLCIGFNSIQFDNAVIGVTDGWGAPPPEDNCYDILREIWRAAGLPAEFNPKTHGGYGLDALCKENFGTNKTGNGATAPADWQHGKFGTVIDYCLNDVYLTKQIFDRVCRGESIISPKDHTTRLTLDIPCLGNL